MYSFVCEDVSELSELFFISDDIRCVCIYLAGECVHYLMHLSFFFKAASDFSVIGLHAKPDDAVNEINSLTDVYEQAVSRLGTSVSLCILESYNCYMRSTKHSAYLK